MTSSSGQLGVCVDYLGPVGLEPYKAGLGFLPGLVS